MVEPQRVKTAVVFGASGQIGQPLLHRLRQSGWGVLAVSRQPQASNDAALQWLEGSFAQPPPLPVRVDALLSCGPLDQFAHWYTHSNLRVPRVVAFSSTSVHVKADSPDPHERDLVRRLNAGEQAVREAAAARGALALLLRPTLVYGAGRDQTLTRLVAMARRWRGLALPSDATGLRQPVHVADLAEAAMSALTAPNLRSGAYDLPGGETLPYADMVGRVLDCLPDPPRFATLPRPLFALLLTVARWKGIALDLGKPALERMARDLVFDDAPARRDLGYRPRAFVPAPDMFGESAPAPAANVGKGEDQRLPTDP